MTTSLPSAKAPCDTCGNKNVGIFKCEGCSKTFCRKHSNEHRDSLSHQLDDIAIEHDTLQQTIVDQKAQQNDHHLIEQINQWEKESIMKIRQTAEAARAQLQQMISTKTEKISSELHHLAERLREVRNNDDFDETDLYQWTNTLKELQIGNADDFRSVAIREDPLAILTAKLNVIFIDQKTEENESLVLAVGNALIKDNGRTVVQRSEEEISYVRGWKTYSHGEHKLRFAVDKTELLSTIVFGVISETEMLVKWPSSCYGWVNTDGCYNGGLNYSSGECTENDLQDKTSLAIELWLD